MPIDKTKRVCRFGYSKPEIRPRVLPYVLSLDIKFDIADENENPADFKDLFYFTFKIQRLNILAKV